MDKLGGFHTYLNAQAEEYMISNTDIRYFLILTMTTSCTVSPGRITFWSLPAVRNGWQRFAHVQMTSSSAVRTIRYCLEQYLYPLSSNPALLSDEGYDLLLSFAVIFTTATIPNRLC